jgi:hypothetical protein
MDLTCINSQEAHAKSSSAVAADIHGVAVDGALDGRSWLYRFGRRMRRHVGGARVR